MNNIQKYDESKAMVCTGNTCATVYGDTAKLVNALVVLIMIVVAFAFISKVAK